MQVIKVTLFLQDDPETLVKCLSIASGMLQNINRSSLNNPTLSTLVETLVSALRIYGVFSSRIFMN